MAKDYDVKKVKLPKWSKEYSKKGASLFSLKQVAMFEFIKRKYAIDFTNFFEEVSQIHDKDAPIQDELRYGIELSTSVGDLIDVLLGKSGKIANVEQVEALFNQMSFLDELLASIARARVGTKGLTAALSKVSAKTGLTVEDLRKSNKAIQKASQKTTSDATSKSSAGQFIRDNIPEIGQLGAGVKGAAIAALGPFGMLAKLAAGTGTGLVKGIGSARRKKGQAKVAKSMALQGQDPQSAEIFKTLGETGHRGAPVFGFDSRRPVYDAEAGRVVSRGSKYRDITRQRRGTRQSAQEPAFTPNYQTGGSGKVNLKSAALPLYYFFDKLAGKAWWTKEVLKELRDKKRKAPAGGLGGAAAGATAAGAAASGLGVLSAGALITAISEVTDKLEDKMGVRKKGATRVADMAKGAADPTKAGRYFADIGKTVAEAATGFKDKGFGLAGFKEAFSRGKDVLTGKTRGSIVDYVQTGRVGTPDIESLHEAPSTINPEVGPSARDSQLNASAEKIATVVEALKGAIKEMVPSGKEGGKLSAYDVEDALLEQIGRATVNMAKE